MRSKTNRPPDPKSSQAREFLCRLIDGGQLGEERRLPAVRALAKEAGVSRSTMWHAVNALRDDGRLQGHYGLRAAPGTAGQSVDIEAIQPRAMTKSHSLQLRIEREILSGRFRHDRPLPSEKQLTAFFGVSRMTLRKALRELTEKAVIDRRGRAFLPVSVTAPASGSRQRIVLFGQGASMAANLCWEYWHQEYVKLAELECSKAGIDLDIVCFVRDQGHLRLRDGRDGKPYSLPPGSELMGCLLEVTNPESMDSELLQLITATKRPLAILDEMGNWPSRDQLARHRNIRIFRNTVSPNAARNVAKLLLELGHRTVVFISPFHHTEYSRQRWEALESAFSLVEDARIIPVTSQFDIWQSQKEAEEKVNLQAMMASFNTWTRQIAPYDIYDGYQPYLYNHFERLRTVVYDGRVREDLVRLLHRALEIKDATALIMVNDFCADHTAFFLDTKRIKVPGRYSIVSFDDTPASVLRGITSYNFGNTATMIAMLRSITNPRLFPASKPVIEIEGHLVQRRTTGKPSRGR